MLAHLCVVYACVCFLYPCVCVCLCLCFLGALGPAVDFFRVDPSTVSAPVLHPSHSNLAPRGRNANYITNDRDYKARVAYSRCSHAGLVCDSSPNRNVL